MALDPETMAAADAERLQALSGESIATDMVFVEVLYGQQWVRFDLSAMEARYLSDEELMARYLVPALKAVSLPRDEVPVGSSSSEMSASPTGV